MSYEYYLNPFEDRNSKEIYISGDVSSLTDDALINALKWYSIPDWNCWYNYQTFAIQFPNFLSVNKQRYDTYKDIIDELEERGYDMDEYAEPYQYAAVVKYANLGKPFEKLSLAMPKDPYTDLPPYERALMDEFLKREAIELPKLLAEEGLSDNS